LPVRGDRLSISVAKKLSIFPRARGHPSSEYGVPLGKQTSVHRKKNIDFWKVGPVTYGY
jgi:hypothetical protein